MGLQSSNVTKIRFQKISIKSSIANEHEMSICRETIEMNKTNKPESPCKFSHTIYFVCPLITNYHPFSLDLPIKKSFFTGWVHGMVNREGENVATQKNRLEGISLLVNLRTLDYGKLSVMNYNG